ncbi:MULTISPECIES: lytic transglycosylase domain-containing protein [unclassified Acinetobacter]|uniref:lytic transglycosylase domain-containing protein n=1 Tax=unclassified Acinetobacter TaxID=196816 RepID=UPI0035B788F1
MTNLTLKSRKVLLASVLAVTGCVTLQQNVHANAAYVYRDSDGETLLTNKKMTSGGYVQQSVTYFPDSNIHTYRNWGSSEASVAPSYSRNRDSYDDIIRSAAQTYNVSEGLIKAVMHTESGFNPNARSPVGAQGLMQLMPATARRFNVSNAYDPQQNIYAGARYLSWLLKRFDNNLHLAIAGYNAGEGNVQKYGGIPPFKETQDYVRRVTSRYQNLYAGGATGSGGGGAITVNNGAATSNNRVLATSPNYSNNSNRQIVLRNGTYRFK